MKVLSHPGHGKVLFCLLKQFTSHPRDLLSSNSLEELQTFKLCVGVSLLSVGEEMNQGQLSQ